MIKFNLEEIKQLAAAATKINNYILEKYANYDLKITVDKDSEKTIFLELKDNKIIVSMVQGYSINSMILYNNNEYNYNELTFDDQYIRRPNMIWSIIAIWEAVKGKLDIGKALTDYRKNKIKNFEV